MIKPYNYAITLDFETNGLYSPDIMVTELGASKIRLDTWGEVARFGELVHLPGDARFDKKAQKATNLTRKQLERAQKFDIVWELFLEDMVDDESCVIAYNVHFDALVLQTVRERDNLPFPKTDMFDALDLIRIAFPDGSGRIKDRHTLVEMSKKLNVPAPKSHRAYHDARQTNLIMRKACERLGITLRQALLMMGRVPSSGITWYQGVSGWNWIEDVDDKTIKY